MGFAKVNDINIHYQVQGTGPNVLFIHGIRADLTNPISAFKTALPQHFTVLAFDPRGLGESDSPLHPCSIADMADDAAGLAAALGWDKYHVLGFSMGGMVAQELALRHPAAVDKLVMGVTNAGVKNGAPVLVDKLDEIPVAQGLQISDTRQDAAWVDAHPEIVERFEQQSIAFKKELQSNPALQRGYANQVNAVLKHDTFDRLAEIKARTLVFGGIHDGSNPPEVISKMVGRIPNARLEMVEHGHGSWYFDPMVWQMIIDFLKS